MTKKYKILNLYACLGGNRYKWNEVSEDIEVTAIELDPELARMYGERFPMDTVIVADAHQYLIDHYKEFDFIWTSPPCPTHSKIMHSQKNRDTRKVKYPDMKLYEEILLLKHFFNGKFCVENVDGYYEPLIPAKRRGRHLYWTNFHLPSDLNLRPQPFQIGHRDTGIAKKAAEWHEIDLSGYKGKQPKGKIAKNLVDFEAGRTILATAMEISIKSDTKQQTIFNLGAE